MASSFQLRELQYPLFTNRSAVLSLFTLALRKARPCSCSQLPHPISASLKFYYPKSSHIHYLPNTSPHIHPNTNHATNTTPIMIALNLSTAIRSPLFAIRVKRPALPRILVDILLKTSFVLSSVSCERALS